MTKKLQNYTLDKNLKSSEKREEIKQKRRGIKKENKREIRKDFPYVIRLSKDERGSLTNIHTWFVKNKMKGYRTHGTSADYMPEQGYSVIRFKKKDDALLFKLTWAGTFKDDS